MTLTEATERRIPRLRLPQWANPAAYVRLDLIDVGGKPGRGPWLRLYDRRTQEAVGEPTPQAFLCAGSDDAGYVEYTGAIDPADGIVS